MMKAITATEQILAGLNLLNKYPNMEISAGHDVLLVMVEKELVSVTDVERLGKLGFDWDDEYDCWRKFV